MANDLKLDLYIHLGYTSSMTQSTVFKSNKTQAVRLPKAVALPDHVTRVNIIRKGNARLIVPAGGTWADFFASPPIDDDFLKSRKQPSPQVRRGL
jgi:antitoxin VapB